MDDEQQRVNEWFDSLTNANRDYDKGFDSKITYIGAGVIALSIAFATHGDNAPSEGKSLFITGEIMAIFAVILNLLSFPLSKIYARHYQDIVSEYIKTGYEGELIPDIDTQEKNLYKVILYYNLFCFVLLVLGIICICIYVFNNL